MESPPVGGATAILGCGIVAVIVTARAPQGAVARHLSAGQQAHRRDGQPGGPDRRDPDGSRSNGDASHVGQGRPGAVDGRGCGRQRCARCRASARARAQPVVRGIGVTIASLAAPVCGARVLGRRRGRPPESTSHWRSPKACAPAPRNHVDAGPSYEADDGGRTRDLRLGKPTLYQLSYIRVSGDSKGLATARAGRRDGRRTRAAGSSGSIGSWTQALNSGSPGNGESGPADPTPIHAPASAPRPGGQRSPRRRRDGQTAARRCAQ